MAHQSKGKYQKTNTSSSSSVQEYTKHLVYLYEQYEKAAILLRSNILLDNPKKHGGHEFFLFATYNQIQVLHCFSREKAVDKRAEQMRMGPLHHIKTLLQYPQLLLLAQLHSLHQWQYISLLLLEVLFTMLLLAHLEQSKLFSTFKDLKAHFSIKGHGENS
jgi:hypothetical protein